MARRGHPVFGAIVSALCPASAASVLDLGCGRGPAVDALRAHVPSLHVTCVDEDHGSVQALAAEALPGVVAAVVDLNDPLPFPDGAFDGAISHNVLECLDDPVALLDETARVLRRGGRAVWSHVDFDGIIIGGADRQLTRSILHAYADHPPRFLATADGQIGRRLPGLIEQSRLSLIDATVHHTTAHRLDSDARARVEEIAGQVRAEAAGLTNHELTTWLQQLTEAAHEGQFFFSEPCVIVTSTVG